jgi:hypothetical protein
MGLRSDLQTLLLEITPKVYFQPPPDLKMVYPCIVYQRDFADTKFAGNFPYSYTQRYQVTLIDRNPDSEILAKIAALPMCLFDRNFATSGLNHDVFTLFF